MASTPTYSSAPRAASVMINTANTARDGSGTITSLLTGVAAGTRVERARFNALETTTAGMIRLFLSYDGGTTWFLLREMPVAAIAVDADTPGDSGEVAFSDLILKDINMELGASTHVAEDFNVHAFGSDLT